MRFLVPGGFVVNDIVFILSDVLGWLSVSKYPLHEVPKVIIVHGYTSLAPRL